MDKITVTSTSSTSASVDDIILREHDTTRLIFRPYIVENPRDPEASVSAWLIHQKKDKDGNWKEDNNILDLRTIKQGECAKIKLGAGCIIKLLRKSEELQRLYKEHGIQYGSHEFVITKDNITDIFNQISKFKNRDEIINALESLSGNDLHNISSIIGISKLSKLLDIWEKNRNNGEEEFWQKIFQEHTWILSQIFSSHFIQIGQKFYCGGKEDDDSGGVKGDLLYKNNLTGNLAFIEIKTPETPIIGPQYRGKELGGENVIYSINGELTGSVNQVLNQKKVYLKTHGEKDGKFLNNPKCILIIGKLDKLNGDENKSFELYRSFNNSVEIITYDELFLRIKNFLDILKE
ncbi:MAG: Shedu immune nuclease family protein [Patescibacteria group bacterium]